MKESFLYKFSAFTFDPEKMVLTFEGAKVQVSPKGLTLLLLLIRERERVVSREELMDEIWNDTFVEEGNINYQISTLRKILGKTADSEESFIRTIPKQGYKFIGDVEEVSLREPEREAESQTAALVSTPKNNVHKSRPWLTAAAVIVLLLIGGTVLIGWRSLSSAQTTSSEARFPDKSDRGTSNDEAYANYQKGKQIWEGRAFSDQAPIEMLKKAIELDPNFAEAHLAMADLYATQANAFAARAALERAKALDPDLPGIYATDAFIKRFLDWDIEGADAAIKIGVEKHPLDSKTRHWNGVLLSLKGRFPEARAEMEKALAVDPTSLIIMSDIAQLSYFAGDFTKAAAELEEVFRIAPNYPTARKYLYYVEIRRGDEKKAIDALINSGIGKSENVAEILDQYGKNGLTGVWQRNIEKYKCTELRKEFLYNCAVHYSLLKNDEKALEAIRLVVEDRMFLSPFIAIDPVFASLRNDQRFIAAMEKTQVLAE